MKHTLSIIPLLTLLLLLAACGSATQTQTNAPTKASQPTPTPTVAKPKHHTVGEEVTVGKNWKITISKVRPAPGKYAVPSKSTDQWLDISVKMVNISNQQEEAIGAGGFQLRDADGTIMGIAGFTIDDDAKPAPQGSVEAGSPISGDLVYEVPKASKTFQLLFMQYSYANGPTTWDIAL